MKIGESYSLDFNVKDADRKDDGVYWCKGRNLLGKTNGVNITLRVRVPPDPPMIQNVEKTNSSLTLTWIKGHEGYSHIIGYSIRYKKAAESNWLTILLNSSVETMYALTELKAFTNYDVKVGARNRIGHGDYSIIFNGKTYPKALSVGPTDLTHDNLTSRTVDLTWTAVDSSRLSFSEGSVLFYEVSLAADGNVTTLTGTRANYMQVNISSGRQYTARVYARNSGPNRSPPSNSVTFGTERERETLSVGGIVGIVVGCVLAALALAVIFVVKKKHCKDKVQSV